MNRIALPATIVALIVLAALILPALLPWSHDAIDWDHVRAPAGSPGHLLGTDELGRDRLARLAVASRITLLVALAAAFVSMVVGIAWGMVAGWAGGRVDEAMMRIVDALYALPFMFIVIVLMVVFGRSILLVFVSIGLVEWLTMARIVRGQVMTLRQRPFVLAATASGAPVRVILWRHILPNIAGVALAYLTLTLPGIIMIESFLSFLGLGVQEPLTSLGILVKEGADDMDVAPMGLLVPGGVMVTLLVCLTLIGEWLRDRFA
ncbi:binding--dependent transport system inner membrane component family protein [Blastomonas sp. RAC04]|uniref:ABC transporter permease n=1 Tax=Blastomonas sp. RAC04 TaxID=1842535 RepID=UPI00083D572F|nr:ABC transporter permease subunit [Blastomonas sp. RAC04]AOG00810.1 binding--dependent transport system inner membrane component family protein [Blastomonas sp. RAC04]